MTTQAISVTVEEDVLKEAREIIKEGGKYRHMSHYVEFALRLQNQRERGVGEVEKRYR